MAKEVCTKNSMHSICDSKHPTEMQWKSWFRVRERSPIVTMPALLAAWRVSPVEERLWEQLDGGWMTLTCAPLKIICHLSGLL